MQTAVCATTTERLRVHIIASGLAYTYLVIVQEDKVIEVIPQVVHVSVVIAIDEEALWNDPGKYVDRMRIINVELSEQLPQTSKGVCFS